MYPCQIKCRKKCGFSGQFLLCGSRGNLPDQETYGDIPESGGGGGETAEKFDDLLS